MIDELPYLLRHSPELPSAIQAFYDQGQAEGGPALRLILCGSAISVMSTLLTGTRALRGRALLDLALQPFDFRQAAAFWDVADRDLALHLDAIIGGTPGYRDLLQIDRPESLPGLAAWLADGVLNPSQALFHEADYLLGEEPTITDRGLYQSVLGAISRGARTPGKVAAALHRDEGSLRHVLSMLERARLVVRDQDVLLQRRPTLHLTDPMLRFHHSLIRPNLARLEQREATDVWRESADTFASQVLGPHFEELARRWTARFASPESLGGRAGMVGTTIVNDAHGKAQHQVDVVALSSARTGGARPILLLGEAKASARPRDVRDLRRLERIKALMEIGVRADPSAAKLAIFARSGFDEELRQAARRRDDVLLVDLERLYSGS